MQPFSYARASDVAAAIDGLAAAPGTAALAGGTTLIDLMKLNVMMPDALIDITGLAGAEPELAAISATATGGVRIGALARMSAVAADPAIAGGYPVVAEALLLDNGGAVVDE